MDGVELEITDEALLDIAQKALDRQIGARGLRAIMEKIMTSIMFLIPSDLSIKKVIITPEAVEGENPTLCGCRTPQRKTLWQTINWKGGRATTPFLQKRRDIPLTETIYAGKMPILALRGLAVFQSRRSILMWAGRNPCALWKQR